MATATVPIPTKPSRCSLAEGITLPGDAFIVRLDQELIKSLAEMAALAHVEVATYIVELVQMGIADFRARKIPADFLIRPSNTPDPPPPCDNIRRGRLTAADEEKVIASMLQGMKDDPCATRFHTSASTIRRVWKRRGPSPEVIQKVLFLQGKRYDEAGPGHSVQAIAKACGVSDAFAAAIIPDHRPLVPSSGGI